MHLYILTRGQKGFIDKFIDHLKTQYFPYKSGITPQDKKMIQLGVRPIQLWEIACPKECMQEVINTIQPGTFEGENKTTNIRKIMGKLCWTLRKMLKLKEVPKFDLKGPRRITGNQQERDMIDVRGIGVSDDKEARIEMI